MINGDRLLGLLLMISLPALLTAQDDCKCQVITEINICYIPRDVHCSEFNQPPTSNCGVTFDNEIQMPIASKLTNTQNFGANGVVNCDISLVALPDIRRASDIEDAGCNIFYVGAFPIDTSTIRYDVDLTGLPERVMRSILEWITECDQNLTIVTQAEAAFWGYRMVNDNQNPNRPLSGTTSPLSIFDGPFGQVMSFSQGGSFQGVFTQWPSTDFEILAADALGRPTVAFDAETNDIVLGDVGILSSLGAGAVSTGTSIVNSNDVLAANIFALGCSITQGSFRQNEFVNICPSETISLPNGLQVSSPGAYVDSLVTDNGCDSIITYIVTETTTRTEMKMAGFCRGESYVLLDGSETDLPGMYRDTTVTAAGCVIITELQLSYFPDLAFDSTVLFFVRPDEEFVFDLGLPQDARVEWHPSTGLSCSDCSNPMVTEEGLDTYQLTITDREGCVHEREVRLKFIRIPYLPNAISPDGDGINDVFEMYFGAEDGEGVLVKQFTVYDRWGNPVHRQRDILPEALSWDGRRQGREVQIGTYTYAMELLYGVEAVEVAGAITVIR